MGVELEEDAVGVLFSELRGGGERERGLCKSTGCGYPADIEDCTRDMGTSEHDVWMKEERKRRKKGRDDSIKTLEKRSVSRGPSTRDNR